MILVQEQKRSAFFIQRSVIFALFLRELKTRFNTPIQYVYGILDPLIQVVAFSVFFWIMGRKSRLVGVPTTMFLVTGIVPWYFFRAVVFRSMAVVRSNSGLFFYRQVKPVDMVIASILVELLVYVSVFFMLLGIFATTGDPIAVENPAGLIGAYAILVILAFAIGLCLMVANSHYPGVARITRVSFRVLYFASGILFPISVVPPKWRGFLLYNPIAQAVDIGRDAYFVAYQSDYADWPFLLVSALALLVFSLSIYRVNRFALLNPTT